MTQPPPGEITRVLTQLKRGAKSAANELVPLVYPHLRSLASSTMHGVSSEEVGRYELGICGTSTNAFQFW